MVNGRGYARFHCPPFNSIQYSTHRTTMQASSYRNKHGTISPAAIRWPRAQGTTSLPCHTSYASAGESGSPMCSGSAATGCPGQLPSCAGRRSTTTDRVTEPHPMECDIACMHDVGPAVAATQLRWAACHGADVRYVVVTRMVLN